MREFMKIVENAQAAFPEEAYEIISQYVGHGSLDYPEQFDQKFERLAQLLKRPTKPMTLLRVLALNPDEADQVQNGGFHLHQRRFSSWTKSADAVERLVFDRRKHGIPVVIKATIPGDHILVDVAAFYRKNHLTTGDFEEWSRYVLHEQEVIIFGNGVDVVLPECVVPFEATSTDAPPQPGQSFRTTYGDRERVRALAAEEDQPGHGVFAIITKGGETAYVRSTAKGWVEVERGGW